MYATIVRYMATRTITIFLVTVIHVFFIVYGSKLRNMKTSPKCIAQNSFKTTLKKACETLLIDSYWLFGSSCYAHATLCKSVFILHTSVSSFLFFLFLFFIFLFFYLSSKKLKLEYLLNDLKLITNATVTRLRYIRACWA